MDEVNVEDISFNEEGVLIPSSQPRLTHIRVLRWFLAVGLEGIHPTAEVLGTVAEEVAVGPMTVIQECVTVGPSTKIGAGAMIGGESIGFERDEKGHILRFPQFGRVVIGSDCFIGSNANIDRSTTPKSPTTIGNRVMIAPQVQIGHNVTIGDDSGILGGSVVAGGARIGKGVTVGAGAVVMNKVKVSDGATIGAGAVVTHDVKGGVTVVGVPARPME